jgi:hypothetical protein
VASNARIYLHSLRRVGTRQMGSPFSLDNDGMMRTPALRAPLKCYNGLHSTPSAIAILGPFRHLPKSVSFASRPTLRVCLSTSSLQRAGRSKTTHKLKDLPQGAIVAQEGLEDVNDAPAYPVVLQGVKNNMLKFKNCVVLTRVGNFYEARLP